MNTPITTFRDQYFFLSNFYPCSVKFQGLVYPSSENAYQAAKAFDLSERKKFLGISASQSKYLGRSIVLRPDWEQVKFNVMLQIIRNKFSDPVLRKMLLSTGSIELIEGNYWHDTFWGVCNGVGNNHLGKILMRVRSERKVKFKSCPS